MTPEQGDPTRTPEELSDSQLALIELAAKFPEYAGVLDTAVHCQGEAARHALSQLPENLQTHIRDLRGSPGLASAAIIRSLKKA